MARIEPRRCEFPEQGKTGPDVNEFLNSLPDYSLKQKSPGDRLSAGVIGTTFG